MINNKKVAQIKEVLADFGAMTAREILIKIRGLNHDYSFSKKGINKLLHSVLNNDRISYDRITFQYSLNDEEENSSIAHSEKSSDQLEEMVNAYVDLRHDYQAFFRIPQETRLKYHDQIESTKIELSILLQDLVSYIIREDVRLTQIEELTSSEIYNEIVKSKRIGEWIKLRDTNHEIGLEDIDERNREFEVLCREVWEDGIVTEDEDELLMKKAKELNLDFKAADQIFQRVKAEELVLTDSNGTSALQKVRINNTLFHIKRVEIPFQPLFYHEFSPEEGKEYIILNQLHEKYTESSDQLILELACGLYYTKQTMTSPHISIFLDRFKQNLKLIE